MIIKDWETIGYKCHLLTRVDNIIVCEKHHRRFTFMDGKLYQSKNIKKITNDEKAVIKKQIDEIKVNRNAKV